MEMHKQSIVQIKVEEENKVKDLRKKAVLKKTKNMEFCKFKKLR